MSTVSAGCAAKQPEDKRVMFGISDIRDQVHVVNDRIRGRVQALIDVAERLYGSTEFSTRASAILNDGSLQSRPASGSVEELNEDLSEVREGLEALETIVQAFDYL